MYKFIATLDGSTVANLDRIDAMPDEVAKQEAYTKALFSLRARFGLLPTRYIGLVNRGCEVDLHLDMSRSRMITTKKISKSDAV